MNLRCKECHEGKVAHFLRLPKGKKRCFVPQTPLEQRRQSQIDQKMPFARAFPVAALCAPKSPWTNLGETAKHNLCEGRATGMPRVLGFGWFSRGWSKGFWSAQTPTCALANGQCTTSGAETKCFCSQNACTGSNPRPRQLLFLNLTFIWGLYYETLGSWVKEPAFCKGAYGCLERPRGERPAWGEGGLPGDLLRAIPRAVGRLFNCAACLASRGPCRVPSLAQ